METPGAGEPFFSAALGVTTEALNRVTSGATHKPDYSISFPAKLITTRLEWDELVLAPEVLEEIQGVNGWLKHSRMYKHSIHLTPGPAGLEALTSPEARLVYRLPEPDVHGRQELRLTPLELLARLARLVPPPRIHRHRYHGVLAPNARLRATVVTIGRPVLAHSPAACPPRTPTLPCLRP